MWESLLRPVGRSEIDDLFEVHYVCLPNYEEKYEEFVADTVELRRSFFTRSSRTPINLRDNLPLDSLAYSLQGIWNTVRAQKDIDLPAHRVMVASIRCEQIKDSQLLRLSDDQVWRSLKASAPVHLLHGFGDTSQRLIDACMTGYDLEASYFDSDVREAKRDSLKGSLLTMTSELYLRQLELLTIFSLETAEKDLKLGLNDAVQPFSKLATSIARLSMQTFQTQLADMIVVGLNRTWESEAVEAFGDSLKGMIAQMTSDRVSTVVSDAKNELSRLLSGPMMGLLERMPDQLWARLHQLCDHASIEVVERLNRDLKGLDVLELEQRMVAYGRERLEAHVRNAVSTRSSRMKDRFSDVFDLDECGIPRTRSVHDDVMQIAQRARLAAANVLAQLAILRRMNGNASDDTEAVSQLERTVLRLARPDTGNMDVDDMSTSTTWPSIDPTIDPTIVLLQPRDVWNSWVEFLPASNVMVQRARATQKAVVHASRRTTPIWVLFVILVLAFDEIMALLSSPFYLVLGSISLASIFMVWPRSY
jgi:protein SEY1